MRLKRSRTFAVVLVFVACRSAPPGMSGLPPDATSGVCGDGVVQAESGEACDGTTDAVCASGVGHPQCTAACTIDYATCGDAGDVVDLVAARNTPCTRDTRGQIRCWGNNMLQEALAPSSGGVRSWAFGNVNGFSTVVLVGADGRFESTVPNERGLQVTDLVQVVAPSAADGLGVCGLRADGRIVCGLRPSGAVPHPVRDVWSPDPAFRAIQLLGSADFLCAVSTASALTCWRFDRAARVFAATAVSAVAVRAPLRALEVLGDPAASPIATWIDADGAFTAAEELPAALMPPDDKWLAISIDSNPESYGCGATAAGTVRCWGIFDQTPSPLDVPGDLGAVTQVAAFGRAACAVTRDHVMRCWGGGGVPPPADRSDVVELRASYRSAQLRTTSDAIDDVFMSGIRDVPPTTTRLYSPGAPAALLGNAGLGMQCTTRVGGQQSCWGNTVWRQGGRRVDVFAAGRNCVLLGDGTASCTGNHLTSKGYPFSLTGWTSLVSTNDFDAPLCGVDGLGLVSCIDSEDRLVSLGALAHPRAAQNAVCGLTSEGARCAGVSYLSGVGMAAPYTIAGSFVDLAPFPQSSSATALVTLSPDGIVGCAGPGGPGDPAVCAQSTLAAGRFRAIADQCGVRDTGAVACWQGKYPSPDELFGTTRVGAGLDLAQDGSARVIYAHGPDGIERIVGQPRHDLAMSLVDLRVGVQVSCGRDTGKVLHCFASLASPSDAAARWAASIPQIAVDDYAVGPFEVCTVTGADTRCYPGLGAPAPALPDAVFRQIAVGRHDACGVTATGTAACWVVSDRPVALAFPVDTPPLAEVTVGHDFACGLDHQRIAHCVQRPDSEQLGHGRLAFVSPVHDFTHLEAGLDHVCGLRTDGSIACFGSDLMGQSSPPPGTGYTSVASGGGYSCAAQPGDRLRCWGAVWYE